MRVLSRRQVICGLWPKFPTPFGGLQRNARYQKRGFEELGPICTDKSAVR